METKKPITPAQQAELLAAVEKAEGPGECQYQMEGEPCCVIGQLAAARGVSIRRLKNLDNLDNGSIGSFTTTVQRRYPAWESLRKDLKGFPRALLVEMQQSWDLDGDRTELRNVVLSWPVVAPEEG